MSQKIVWTIAGSDSGGYSGIQNDLKTFHSLGAHGCSVITAITSQNRKEIKNVFYLPEESISTQICALQEDLPPMAIKIGMLGDLSILKVVKNFLEHYSGKIVLDPLIVSTSGNNLFASGAIEYIKKLITLFSLVDVITPNIHEAEKIVGRDIKSHQDIALAAQDILSLGAKSVLIKGGHFENDYFSQDYWTNGADAFWLANHRINKKCRGTGCTLSSAITACLALGYEIKDAIVIAKMVVNQGIHCSNSSLFVHAGWPEQESYLPYLSHHPLIHEPKKFKQSELGLYPIVDSADWVNTLLSAGVKTLQLRIKNKNGAELEDEIKRSIALAKQYQAKLFINDYWELAIRYHAYGVHLGQDDLKNADIEKIHDAGLHLGISTHCYYEVARAHTFRPSYLACGPIFPTTSKIMPFLPQGIEQLQRWRTTLHYPLVAIGGINASNFSDVLNTKVDGIAMISAITQSPNPLESTKHFLKYDYHTR